MEKGKIRELIKDSLQSHLNKNDNLTKSSDGLHQQIICYLNGLYELPQSDFKSRLAKLKTDIKSGISFEKATDTFLDFLPKIKTIPDGVSESTEKPKKMKITRRVVTDFGGWGGKRGKSKEWRIYVDAEKILFRPSEVLKDFKLNISEIEFYRYIRRTYHGLNTHNLNSKVYKAVNWSISKLVEVVKAYLNLYNPSKQRHKKLVSLTFGEDSGFYFKGKGKQITDKSIDEAINDVRKHIYSKKIARRDEKFYTDKKLYYITWLTSIIDKLLDLTPSVRKKLISERIKFPLNQIKSIMEDLPLMEQKELLDDIMRELTPKPLNLPDGTLNNLIKKLKYF